MRVISNTVHVMRIATDEIEDVITDALSRISLLNNRVLIVVFNRPRGTFSCLIGEPARALFSVSSFRAWPAC